MATAATADAQDVLATWAANGGGLTDDEKIRFSDQVLEQLADNNMVNVFQDNIKQVGIWANQIDETFDKVAQSFANAVAKYGKDFPWLATYNTEWFGYQGRWVSHLSRSREVASVHAVLLGRFDKVYLDMVESIVTNNDRLDVISELQPFIEEEHDGSPELAQSYIFLKRDIGGFVNMLGQFIQDNGVDILPEVESLKDIINGLQSDIAALDGKINDASIALGSPFFSIIGMAVSGGPLASYRKERDEKAAVLATKKAELAEANRKQEHALASLKGDLAGLMPDIALFCRKQASLAEIWPLIRNQTLQFQEHLKGGMDAFGNMRFKKEVQVARAMRAPLQAGLKKYWTVLEIKNLS